MPFGLGTTSFNKFWTMQKDESEEGPSKLKMFVYGPIYANRKSSGFFSPSEEQAVAKEFQRDLKNAGPVDEIHVFINSPGGQVFAALGMMNQLLEQKAKVITYGDGLVGSAATLIFSAGEERVAKQGSSFFYHNPAGAVQGNKKQIMQGVELLEKLEEGVLDIYEGTSNLARKDLRLLLEKESTLTAQEAVDKGFATRLQKREKKEAMMSLTEAVQFCNESGLSFAMTMLSGLESTYSSLLNSTQKEGEDQMTYTEFFNSLTPEQQALVAAEMTKNSAEIAQKAASLTAELTELKSQQQQAAPAATGATSSPENNQNTEVLANLSPEAKAQVEALQKAVQESQAQLKVLQEKQKFAEFTASLTELAALPLDEATQKSLYEVADSNAENYGRVLSLLKVANQAMETQFAATGSDRGHAVGGSAFAQMEAAIAKKQQENPQMPYADAMKAVTTEQPQLWERYRAEIASPTM